MKLIVRSGVLRHAKLDMFDAQLSTVVYENVSRAMRDGDGHVKESVFKRTTIAIFVHVEIGFPAIDYLENRS